MNLSRLLAGVLSVTICPVAASATIDVLVVDALGQPIPEVVVFTRDSDQSAAAPEPVVLDQIDRRFEPHILVIEKGTAVSFPNSDAVAHHVYSFSKPNDFALPLYKGTVPDPVRFEHEGIVTIGCNIHDDMLAYVVVVDSSSFAKTDQDGHASLDLPATGSESAVTAWSPRFRGNKGYRTQNLPAGETQLVIQIKKKLRPPHTQGTGSSTPY